MERTVLILMIIIICSEAHKKKDSVFVPYGLAQYSFLWEYSSGDNKGNSLFKNSNKIGIYYGFILKTDHKLMLKFQFGNDWCQIKKANYPLDNLVTVTEKSYLSFPCPFFHLAYIQWGNVIYVQAGKLPVESYGPLDLVERSLAADNFEGVSWVGWSTATNSSILGTRTGLHLFQGSFSPEFFATLIKKSKHDSQNSKTIPPVSLFIFNIPFRLGRLSLTPQIVIVYNRNYDLITEKANNEIGWGFHSTYEHNKSFRFYASGAWARLTNYNSKYLVNSSCDYRGFQLTAGTSCERGKILMEMETRYSRAMERKSADLNSHFLYCEFKSRLKLNRYISILPQIRFFQSFYTKVKQPGKALLCPEIVFRGQF